MTDHVDLPQDYADLQQAARDYLKAIEGLGVLTVLSPDSPVLAAEARLRKLAQLWR